MDRHGMRRLRTVLARLRHGMTVFAHDVVVIPLAWLGAYWLRFNLDTIPPAVWRPAVMALPVVMVLQSVS